MRRSNVVAVVYVTDQIHVVRESPLKEKGKETSVNQGIRRNWRIKGLRHEGDNGCRNWKMKLKGEDSGRDDD